MGENESDGVSMTTQTGGANEIANNMTRYWSVAANRIDLQGLTRTRNETDGLQLIVFVSKVFPSGT